MRQTVSVGEINDKRQKLFDLETIPLVLVEKVNSQSVLTSVNRSAERAGLYRGLSLSDARVRCSNLYVAKADFSSEYKALESLAVWCLRYTPWTATDVSQNASETSGLWLDISGSAHLFGGEAALLKDLSSHLAYFGYTHRIAIADTPGTSWAIARFKQPPHKIIISVSTGKEETKAALAPLPVTALRVASSIIDNLLRLGLNCIGQLLVLPRAHLTLRFGASLVHCLDQALGNQTEIIQPIRAIVKYQSRLVFAEPILDRAVIENSLGRLLNALWDQLEVKHLGARQLTLSGYQVDGDVTEIAIGTSRPLRNSKHVINLFEEKLKNFDLGFGIELLVLSANTTDPLVPSQSSFIASQESQGLPYLIDRLNNRFGSRQVFNLVPVSRHRPEHAQKKIAAFSDRTKPLDHTRKGTTIFRPLQLLTKPEPIRILELAGDRTPVIFEWRARCYRVALTGGPERISTEWWLNSYLEPFNKQADSRDYFHIEDIKGLRFWVFCAGLYQSERSPKWFMHGFFP